MLVLRTRPTGLRAVRVLLSSVVVMVFVAAAHTWAGGELPDIPSMVALTALVAGAGWFVVPGRWRIGRLLPWVAAAQVGLHVAFALITAGDATAPAVGATGHAGHLAPGTLDAAVVSGPDLHLTGPMLLAHALSTVVTGVAWALARQLVEVVVGWREAPAPGPVPAAPTTGVPAPTDGRSRLFVLTDVSRRGPPRGLCPA